MDVIGQTVADMRVEYYDALRDGRKIKAEWIKALLYVHIARALTIDRLLGAALGYILGTIRDGKH